MIRIETYLLTSTELEAAQEGPIDRCPLPETDGLGPGAVSQRSNGSPDGRSQVSVVQTFCCRPAHAVGRTHEDLAGAYIGGAFQFP